MRTPRGEWVATPADLTDCGKRRAVDEALAELARAGAIRRIGRELYDRPVFSEFLGRVVPANLDLLVRAIGRRDGVRFLFAVDTALMSRICRTGASMA